MQPIRNWLEIHGFRGAFRFGLWLLQLLSTRLWPISRKDAMVSRVLVLCVTALAAATTAQGKLATAHEELHIYSHGSVQMTTAAIDTTAGSPVQAVAKTAAGSTNLMPVVVDDDVLVRDYNFGGGMNGNVAMDPVKNELAASGSSNPRAEISSGVVVLCGVVGALAAVLVFAALVVRHDRAVRENTLTSDEIFDIEAQSNASEAEEAEDLDDEAEEEEADPLPVAVVRLEPTASDEERRGIQDDAEPLSMDAPATDDQADEADGTNEYVASPGHIAKLFLMMVGDML